MEQDKQKIALITGASRGLGAAMSEWLAAHGWHIIAVARTVGALEELDDRIGARGSTATLAPMDVTEADAMSHLAASVMQRWGGIDLWIHTAIHATPLTPVGHVGDKDWTKSVSINITATQQLIARIEPLLRPRDGVALFLDDPRAGEKFHGTYGATKAAQMALARSWQAEGARIGPRVVIAHPAPMPTALRARFYPGEDRARLTPCAVEADRILSDLFQTAQSSS